MPLSPGTTLGPYVVDAFLASGGMGEVYSGRDPRLGRPVAIKVLREGLADRREFRQRFKREIQAIGRLNHQNICTIYDIGQRDDRSFIVMELLDGENLESILADGPLPVDRALQLAIQVADALDVAHRAGIIHRDIKSANLIVTGRGDVKILDFGVAKFLGPERPARANGDRFTTAGSSVGTLAYMSPEQASGDDVDARSDLFSFGVVLFEMITGRLPFEGPPMTVMRRLVSPEPAPSARRMNPEVPEELERLIGRALEKDRRVRYQTAGDFLAALRRLRRDLSTGERPSSTRTPPLAGREGEHEGERRSRSRRSIYAALALLLLTFLAIGVREWAVRDDVLPTRDLAVLPCTAEDPSVARVCDVLAERFIAALDRVPELEVKSFQLVNSVDRAGRSPVDVGQELGVDLALTILLRDQSPLLDVAVEVTDTDDGSYVWGKTYARPVSDTGDLYETVALDVAEALQFRLTARDRDQLRLYQTYETARYHWERRSAEGLARAIELFSQVIEEDPTFARAHAGLALAYVLLPYYTSRPAEEVYPLARGAAQRALDLDDSLADAHAALGLVNRDFDRQWERAEREFQRAIQLDPGSGTALQWYAELLASTGRFEGAESYILRARNEQPLSLTIRAVHGWILLCAGRVEEAREILGATAVMDPDHPLSHWFLGQLHVRQGDYGLAVESLTTAVELSGESSRMVADLASALALGGDREGAMVLLEDLQRRSADGAGISRYEYAIVYAGMGQRDRAVEELEGALEERTWQVLNMAIDPMLRPVREDDRYPGLLARLGLPTD